MSEGYQRIIEYNFNEEILSNKLVVKFKIRNTFKESQFINIFSHKRGERFVIRSSDNEGTKIGIGYESTWLLDSNYFLVSFDNNSVLSGFEELKTQITTIEIDEHDEEYFGIYGGLSDGNNKNTQEWVDFSDTMFVIPNILAVFKEEYIYFTLFFDLEDNEDFSDLWRSKISFLEQLENYEESIKDPKITVVRDVYPEVWQENIRKALLKMEQDELKRIVLSRKNQVLLENNTSLTSLANYLIEKNRYFIVFEMRKSLFLTTNPLTSLEVDSGNLSAYLYLKQESIFSNKCQVMFDEKDILNQYRENFEKYYEKPFEIAEEIIAMGKKMDIYYALKAQDIENDKAIKALSLLYPIPLLKGYPEKKAEEFLNEYDNIGYGFWYSPFGYIDANFNSKFYTCGNMMIGFENMITLFTSILLTKGDNYEEVLEKTNNTVKSRLKVFNH